MEHFIGNLSSDIQQWNIKGELKNVIEAGHKADQLCAAYGSCKSYVFNAGKNSAYFPNLQRIWPDTKCKST